MTFDSVLMFLTLLAAVYTILPEYRRRELKFRIGLGDIVIIAFSILFVHYLLFFDVFKSIGLTPELRLHRHGLTTKNISYLATLLATCFVIINISRFRLNRNKIFSFKNLVSELIEEGRYSDLVKIIYGRGQAINKIVKSDYCLSNLRKKWQKRSLWEVVLDQKEGESKKESEILNKFAELLPTYKRHADAAKELINLFLSNKGFANYTAKLKPYFIIEVYHYETFATEDFISRFYQALLENKSSIYYQELKNNQNLVSGHRYAISDENRLLKYLFKDARVGEKHGAWKPIGEYVISYLDQLRKQQSDRYNLPMEDYSEGRKWECPIYSSFHFFDVMVSEALYQNIQWHMWLYYFPHFTKRIVRNSAPESGYVDLSCEFPTPYHYLLYEQISTLRNWIREGLSLPQIQANTVIEATSPTHENGCIPKSSMLAMGQCIYEIFASRKFQSNFLNYLASIVFDLYFDLKNDKNRPNYHEALINCIWAGGFRRYENITDYHKQLQESWKDFDKIPHLSQDIEELEIFLFRDI